jgi:hypothetical protein
MQVKTIFIGGRVTLYASGYLTTTATSAPLGVAPIWSVDLPAVVSISPTGLVCVCNGLTSGVAVVSCTSGILPVQQVQINVVDPLTPADVLNVTVA